jgi:hypothetical protein
MVPDRSWGQGSKFDRSSIDRGIKLLDGPSRPGIQALLAPRAPGYQAHQGTIAVQPPSCLGSPNIWEPSAPRHPHDQGSKVYWSLILLGIKPDDRSMYRVVLVTRAIDPIPTAWIQGTKGPQAPCRPWKTRSLGDQVPCKEWLPGDHETQLDQRPIQARDQFSR